jgi:hypothetical protein
MIPCQQLHSWSCLPIPITIFGHFIFNIFLRHLLMNNSSELPMFLVLFQVTHPNIRTAYTFVSSSHTLVPEDNCLDLHTENSLMNDDCILLIWFLISCSVPPSLVTTDPRHKMCLLHQWCSQWTLNFFPLDFFIILVLYGFILRQCFQANYPQSHT